MRKVKPIKPLILTIRGSKMLIDADLAGIYGVETRALNQAVKRNLSTISKGFHFSTQCGRETRVDHKL